MTRKAESRIAYLAIFGAKTQRLEMGVDPHEFFEPENWLGSFYELAMEYAPYGDDKRLLHAQRTLWDTPSLRGPYAAPYESGDETFRLHSLPTSIGPEDTFHLHGVFNLPRDRSLGALSVTVREVDRSDWLIFCLPTGMLELVYPHLDYPLERAANPWMDEIDSALLALAEAVYMVAPFNFALVGEEVSGVCSFGDLSAGRLPQSGFLVPSNAATQLRIDVPSVALQSGLSWFALRSRRA